YENKTYGFNLKAGISLSEELSFAPRYSLYRQEISLPAQLNNCTAPGGTNPVPGCYGDGEASLPVRIELAPGPVLVSLLGYSLAYSTLDNNKSPTSGLYAEFRQDFAGVGGDVNFIRSTADARYYFESFPAIV